MKLPGDIEKMLHDDPDIPERYKKHLRHGNVLSASPASSVQPHQTVGRRPSSAMPAFWRHFAAIMMYCPIRRDGDQNKWSLPHLLWRILEAVVLRALIAPLMIALFMGILVCLTTRPGHIQAELTPAGLGLPHRTATIPTTDGLLLDAWFIPALDPETVAAVGSAATHAQRPGVVLVHGLGLSHVSYLSLADQLHRKGYAVLLVSTRGQGASSNAAVTFGLCEANDVLAAIAYLRRQPGVRHDAVAAVGFGTGGVAVLRANALIAQPLAAVVADSVWMDMDDYLASTFRTRQEFPTEYLAPFYRMSFETLLGQSMSDWKLGDALSDLPNKPLLLVRQGHERSPLRDILNIAEQVADVRVIAQDREQNFQADELTLRYLTQMLGKY